MFEGTAQVSSRIQLGEKHLHGGTASGKGDLTEYQAEGKMLPCTITLQLLANTLYIRKARTLVSQRGAVAVNYWTVSSPLHPSQVEVVPRIGLGKVGQRTDLIRGRCQTPVFQSIHFTETWILKKLLCLSYLLSPGYWLLALAEEVSDLWSQGKPIDAMFWARLPYASQQQMGFCSITYSLCSEAVSQWRIFLFTGN